MTYTSKHRLLGTKGSLLVAQGTVLCVKRIARRTVPCATIAKGIRRVVSGKNRYDSGSRYWKGAIKRGLAIISDGVKALNVAQGCASVIGSETAGIISVTKTIIKTRRGTM